MLCDTVFIFGRLKCKESFNYDAVMAAEIGYLIFMILEYDGLSWKIVEDE